MVALRAALGLMALVLILIAVSAPAVAYHDHTYVDKHLPEPCVDADASAIHAHCVVDEEGRVDVPAPGAEGASVEGEVDFRDAADAAPDAETPAPVGDGERAQARDAAIGPALDSRDATDPAAAAAAERERDAKTGALDAAESTGLHFRLLCGWDLPSTRPACDVHNPEEESALTFVRAARDAGLRVAGDAVARGAVDATASTAPFVSAHVALHRVAVVVEGPPADDRPETAPTPADAPARAPTVAGGDTMARDVHAPGPDAARPAPAPDAPDAGPPGAHGDAREPLVQGAVSAAAPHLPPHGLLLAAAGAGLGVAALAALAYRHLERRALLSNATRRSLYERVDASPGATIMDLAEAEGVAHETARYHLQVLEDHGMVVSERVGNRRHYFKNGGEFTHRERLIMSLDASGVARDVFESLRSRRGRRVSALARELGLSKAGLYWHLKRLEGLGLVERVDDGKRRRYRATRAEG